MAWIALHWPDLFQSIGIIGSLFLATRAAHRENQARRSATLLKLTEQHRELWREMLTRDDLSRILRTDVDLVAEPLTKPETIFATLLFLHLNTAYNAIQAGVLEEPEGMSLDIKIFFALPVPAMAWARMKYLQNGDFIAYIESKRAG